MRVCLKDIANVIRSKNAGPFELTLDVLLKDSEMFERIRKADVINKAIDQAVAESVEQGIQGKATTPFLLARVKDLTGESYVATQKRRIATVSIGYADGYNRSFSGTGYVVICGKKAPVLGRVCMDLVVVDVSDIPEVKIGMPATILGDGITAEDLGEMCGSFNYEVVCNFAKRVTAVYK